MPAPTLAPAPTDCADDALVACDLAGHVTAWNAAAERLFGHPCAAMAGRDASCLVPATRTDEARRLAARVLRGDAAPRIETLRLHRDGRLLPVGLTVEAERDAAGAISGLRLRFHDLAPRVQAERLHRERLHLDPLTLLPHRASLLAALDRALHTASRGHGRVALVAVALDHLAEIARHRGPAAAQALRVQAAARLRDACGDTALLARAGEDRFAVLQAPADAGETAAAFAARLADTLAAPFTLDGSRIVLGARAVHASGPEPGQDGAALLHAAEAALDTPPRR